MSFSTRGKYGIRALLAIVKAEQPLSAARIARMEDLSPPYLEQILNKLKRAGIVRAKRGAYGGYLLNRRADKLTVGEIVGVLDGPIRFSRCHHVDEEEECERRDICASRRFWLELENDINRKLFGTTLQDLQDIETGLVRELQNQ